MIDGDGNSIATEFETKFVVRPGDDDVPSVRHLTLSMKALRFENYGPYAIRVEVDEREIASLPFSVVPAAPIPAQSQ